MNLTDAPFYSITLDRVSKKRGLAGVTGDQLLSRNVPLENI